MSTEIHKLIIIGSGPAGLTAAIYASRANMDPILIEGIKPGGQLIGTSYVENWPGEKSILGPQLMMKIKEHAKHFGTQFISQQATRVDFTQKPFKVWTNNNTLLQAHSIIIATGANPKKLNCPGEEEYWGKGVTTCAVCDGAFYPDKRVLVIGGGDTAMEDASFLKKFTNKVTIVQIGDALSASHAMQQRVINDPDITILYNSTVTKIEGNGSHITSATVTNSKTGIVTQLELDGIFIAVGLNPNTDIFKNQLDLDKFGYIDVKNHTHSSVDGVFVAGDVADYRYRQAITSAGSGCMAALDAERYLHSII